MGTTPQPNSGIETDPSPSFQDFAHPDRLVSNDWLGAHLGVPGLKVVESNEDGVLYNIGHIPTAVRIDWTAELGDPVMRDIVDGAAFAALMDSKGISREDTVVVYGDRSNLWAIYTYWVFTMFGHPDVRLLDGGRDAWMQEDKEISYASDVTPTTGYPVVERNDSANRIFARDLLSFFPDATADVQIIDMRDPEHYAGDADVAGASRLGHIPTAINLSLRQMLLPNSRFPKVAALREEHAGLDPAAPTVVYCSDGSRAAVEWFILRYLLGWENVRLYDGSWREWGNMIRMPIARGPQAGS